MRLFRILALLALSFALAACGDDMVSDVATATAPATADDDTETDSPAEPESVVVDEGSDAASAVFDLNFVLPGLPEDVDAPQPVASVGEPVDPARLNTDEIWLWCEDRGDATFGTAILGDIWKTEQGAGVLIQINAALLPGTYELPSPQDELVLFLVDLHGDPDLATEYSSSEEESWGSVTIESVPCGDDNADLAFTVDGAIGAETNPGFISATEVTGSLRIAETGEPPDWPWFEQ